MSLANLLLGGESGLAFVADDMSAIVKGHSIPFDGNVNNLFTYTSPSTKYIFNSAGLLVPGTTLRCDYDPVTLLPKGLLIEEQRTNLLVRSSELDNGSWTKSNASVTADQTTAPDGTSGADLVTENTANSTHVVFNGFTATSGSTYTVSAFVKAGTQRYIGLRGEDTDATAGVSYPWIMLDTQTGTIAANGAVTASSVAALPGGWYRISLTYVAGITGTDNLLLAGGTSSSAPATSSLGPSYVGTSQTFYVWGAQAEAGAFPTSYIPTAGSTVTRAADTITLAVSAFPYAQATWTVDAWVNDAAAGGDRIIWSMDTGIQARRANPFRSAAGLATAYLNGATGGSGSAVLDNQNVGAGAFKQAIAYAVDDAAGVTNGGTPATDNSLTLGAFTTLRLGQSYAAATLLNGHLKTLRFVPRRRPNAELQSITA